jgi:hypothetical protein
MADEKFQLLHPEGKQAPRIAKAKYDLMRATLLQLIPADAEGVPLANLSDRVAEVLTTAQLADLGKIGWYTMGVKLDMETRGEIERVPNVTPQRLRRKS